MPRFLGDQVGERVSKKPELGVWFGRGQDTGMTITAGPAFI